LTNEDVEDVRRRYAAGELLRVIAKDKKVGQSTIYRAVHGETKFESAVPPIPLARVGELTRGERNGTAKLTTKQVQSIYISYHNGDGGYITLGRIFGVSPGTIRNIVIRKLWKQATEGL
jgi:hypothetical protein